MTADKDTLKAVAVALRKLMGDDDRSFAINARFMTQFADLLDPPPSPPKFKVGDWVIANVRQQYEAGKVTSVDECTIGVERPNGCVGMFALSALILAPPKPPEEPGWKYELKRLEDGCSFFDSWGHYWHDSARIASGWDVDSFKKFRWCREKVSKWPRLCAKESGYDDDLYQVCTVSGENIPGEVFRKRQMRSALGKDTADFLVAAWNAAVDKEEGK